MEQKKNGLIKKIEHWQWISWGLRIYDFIAIVAAFFLGLWLRFDCRFSMIPDHYLQSYYHFAWIAAIFTIVVFWRLKLYNSLWRFASYTELVRMSIATIISFVFHSIGITRFMERMPLSYYVFGIVWYFSS